MQLHKPGLTSITTALIAILLCQACARDSYESFSSVPERPAVDHHVHVLGPELVHDWKSLGVEFSRPESAYTSVSTIFGQHDTQAFLVSMAHIYGSDDFRSGLDLTLETEQRRVQKANEHVAREVARMPGVFTGFCSVPLLRPYAQAEIRRCRDELNLLGLKIHLPASGINLTRSAHLQILAMTAAGAAADHQPLLVHLAPAEGELSSEELRAFIDQVVDPNPDLELYLAHLGGNGGYRISAQRSVRAFTEYLHANEANAQRSIYVELSGALLSRTTDGVPASTREDARKLAANLRALGLDRVLFGSDYPVFDREEFSSHLRAQLPLTPAEITRIMQNKAPAIARSTRDPPGSAGIRTKL